LTVEAIVGDAEIFAPSNRIPWIFRHPTIVQAELIRPERSLDDAGFSGRNLSERRRKKGVSGPDLLPQREIDEKWVITRSGCPRSQGIIDREVNASLPASGVRVMEIKKTTPLRENGRTSEPTPRSGIGWRRKAPINYGKKQSGHVKGDAWNRCHLSEDPAPHSTTGDQ
jgi:hypothetical protein